MTFFTETPYFDVCSRQFTQDVLLEGNCTREPWSTIDSQCRGAPMKSLFEADLSRTPENNVRRLATPYARGGEDQAAPGFVHAK